MLLEEPGALVVKQALDRFELVVSSRLLGLELRRVALRDARLAEAEQLLSGVSFLPLDERLLAATEIVEPAAVGTLDAIHLATALRLFEAGRLDALMTYDIRLAAGARERGITVLAPA